MKKILSGILVLMMAASVFAQSKGSVEGIIEVAGDNRFPAGHFGQAAGYLPGDSVFVTNPATGLTLQFLNLGTLDSAEGVTILLSKESAKTLGLDRNAKVHCKLDIRNGSFDESVTGHAVIDDKNYVPAAAEKKEAEVVVVEAPIEPVAAPVPETETVVVAPAAVEVAGVPLFDEEEAEDVEEEIIEEPVEVVEIKEETPKEPVVLVLPPNPSDEEVIEEFEVEDKDFIGTKEAVEQPSPAELSEAEEAEVEAVIVVEAPAVKKEPVEELVIVEELAPVVIAKECTPAVKTVETPVAVVEESSSAVADETSGEDAAYVASETADADSDENVEDEYAPIVLVPTDKVAPEAVERNEAAAVLAEPAPVVPAVESVEERKVAVEKEYRAHDYEKYIVESESSLPRNRWYVQIVTLGNVENLDKTVRKYSKYPLALIPNGKGSYRILVGPLTEDEYGVVLAKFKAFGYKDAFLKRK